MFPRFRRGSVGALLALVAMLLGSGALAAPANAGVPDPSAAPLPTPVDTWPGPYADAPPVAGGTIGADTMTSPLPPTRCADAAYKAGWRGVDLVVGTAIQLGESNCDPSARGTNPPTEGCPQGSVDRGVWQINDCYHSEISDACAYDVVCANTAAYAIWKQYGFSQWTVYRLRLFKSHLNEARVAVKKVTGQNIVVGVVTTEGGPLTIRKKPTTKSEAVGTFAKDAIIQITCQIKGENVYSTVFDVETRLWDSTGPGKYVSDGYMYTDTPKRIAPKCGRPPPQ